MPTFIVKVDNGTASTSTVNQAKYFSDGDFVTVAVLILPSNKRESLNLTNPSFGGLILFPSIEIFPLTHFVLNDWTKLRLDLNLALPPNFL